MDRFVLNTSKPEMEEKFGITSASQSLYEPNFNAHPGNILPIIIANKGKREIVKAVWGISNLNGSVSKKHSISKEEVLENPKYVDFIKSQACIIPLNGFYMWKNTVKDPLPFYVRKLASKLLGVAGFYVEKTEKGHKSLEFLSISMASNVLLKPLDEHMPCILEAADFDAWLKGDAAELLEKKFNSVNLIPDLAVYRVANLVNDISQNSKELIQPIPKLRDDD